MKTSNRLKQLREEFNMTQKEIANKLGVTRAAVGLYEQGKRNIDNDTLLKLSQIFNVSADYLLGNTDERTPAHKIKEEYESEEAEIEELMERFNVHLNGEVLTKEDKNSVIAFLKMLRDRDKVKK